MCLHLTTQYISKIKIKTPLEGITKRITTVTRCRVVVYKERSNWLKMNRKKENN